MPNIHFERRKNYKSTSIFVTLIVVVLLLLFVPIMLMSRTRSIINHKLQSAEADTTYVKLVSAALSYLQTADAFVVFRSKDEALRQELLQQAQKRYLERCQQVDSADIHEFCRTWAKVLNPTQLKQCEKCSGK